jgi:secondary thiamine-phosphate synthase enzyme
VYSPHTTCGISLNEGADPDVREDLINKLNDIIPVDDRKYRHLEGNSHSHIKTVVVGSSVTIFIENGKLLLGRWQSVYLCEFDGPRRRNVWVKILSEDKI